jgi:hypothetical protein
LSRNQENIEDETPEKRKKLFGEYKKSDPSINPDEIEL